MTAIDMADVPPMVGTRPPPRKGAGFFSRTAEANPFESIPIAAYEQPVWRQPSPFMRSWMVSDPAGLKQVLIGHPEQFVSTIAEKLLMYGLGRNLQYYDAPAVRAIVHSAAAKNYSFEALVAGVIKSPAFQLRANLK